MKQDAGRNEPIAIIGMGCRFPGGASKPSRLWELLEKPIDVSKEIPKDRFNLERFYHKDGPHHGTTNARSSYFLEQDISHFDNKFFAIPPGEAAAIDPQQRLLLEVVYEAVDAAGLSLHGMAGSNTGVYVGIMCQDYFSLQAQDVNSVPTYAATGIAASNASSRISYFFDWHGPSMTIDTACSSSLVGLHEAVQALRSGVSTVAVACGTNLLLSAFSYITESKLGMLSPTGKSRMWDIKADGYARGEGVASIVLKTLSQAVRDGDRIESVIREVGVNHDGRTKGLTMPSAAAQAALIHDTYHRAGLDPTTKTGRCQYFEAHGTGTPAGDPQEAEALSRAFFPNGSSSDSEDDVLLVGSIKTIIGHTEGTAGLAGLIKACLALQNSKIPPNLLFDEPNPAVVPFMNHLRIPTSSQPWPSLPAGTPRRASVNSFGFGGTNAHAILESYELPGAVTRVDSLPSASQVSTIPVVLSAASEKSLVEVVKLMLGYLNEQQQQLVSLPDLAWTLVLKRSALSHRLCVPATSIDQLRERLDACLATVSGQEKGKDAAKLGIASLSGPSSILGIFTGQGAQWPQMGQKLMDTIPAAAEMLARLDLSLATLPVPSHRPVWTLAGQLAADKATSRLAEAALSQPLCTAVQIVLVELLRRAGVTFRAVVGHSSGEIGAAYAAGFLSASDAIRIAYYRGFYAKLAAGASGEDGGMLAVGTSIEDARELCDIDDFANSLWLAAHNSPTSVSLSGDKAAVDQALEILEEEGKFARTLRVDTAYHSPHMARCSAAYLASLRTCHIVPLRPEPADGAPLWFSSVYDNARVMSVERAELDGQYWVDNMTNPVLFCSAVTAAVSRDSGTGAGLGLNAAIEVGPHPALQGPAQDTIQSVMKRPIPYSGTLKRGADDVEAFAAALGFVWSHFGPGAVDLGRFQETCNPGAVFRAVVDLPSYPWDHGRPLWVESRPGKLFRLQEGRFHDLLGLLAPDGTAEQCRWRNTLNINEIAWLSDHALQGQPVFPGAGYILMAMEAGLELAKGQPVESIDLLDLEIVKAIALSEAFGCELVVSMTDIQREAKFITAKYTVFSTPSEDASNLSLNTTGNVRITLWEEGPGSEGPPARAAVPRSFPAAKLAPVDVDRFYQVLAEDLGYGYTGPFRGLVNIQRRLGFSTATVQNTTFGEHETCLLFHPGMLDSALQALNAAYSAPGDGRLWQIVAPTHFTRVTLIPALCGPNITDLVEVDCTITDDTNNEISGDIEVYCADKRVIEIEAVRFSPFAAATSKDDRHMFQEVFLSPDEPDADIVHAAVSSSLSPFSSAEAHHQKGIDAERAAFYYLKNLHQNVSPHVRKDLPWYRQLLLNNAEKLYELVKRGGHPHAETTWIDDTEEDIEAVMDAYGDDADFNLTRAVGEHLLVPEILCGDTSILEHMTHENYLDRYYVDAIGFETLNQLLAGIMSQLCTKFPRMDILEIGAGTGSGTKAVLGSVGPTFASYTYTDISSGFFEKAAEKFRTKHGHKMAFKVLDIESDPGPQGFVAGAYDVVVASNVLHATKSMKQTLTHTRALLKPGGFLVLLEIIRSDVMRHGLVMGGLPGWWVGHEDGRETGPSLTLTEWDVVLRQTGFGGIETSSPMPDIVTLPGSVFVSRAINDQVSLLREPLAAKPALTSSGPLLVIGGESEMTNDICGQLASLLKPYYDPVTCIPHMDFLPEHLPSDLHVVSLTECDYNMFEEMDSVRWDKVKRLLSSTASMLWLLRQSRGENPYAGTTLGLFRTLFYELPGTLLQTLDLGQSVALMRVDPSTLADLVLRLSFLAMMMRAGGSDKVLWNFEPELVLQRDGRLYVPRVRQNETLNARYNSSKRSIWRSVNMDEALLELVKREDTGLYFVREQHHIPDIDKDLGFGSSVSDGDSGLGMTDEYDVEDPSQADMVTIKVSWSLLTSLKTPAGYFYLQLGRDIETGHKTLCWSNSNTSTVTVHRSFTIRVDQDDPGREIIDVHFMSFAVGELMAQQVISRVPPKGIVMAHEPDPTVASLLARHLASVGRKAVFITSKAGGGGTRNWIYLDPNSPKRLIDAAVPANVSLYVFDTSKALSSRDSLGNRICGSLPELCERLHLESLSSSRASDLPDKAPRSLARLLRKAQEFGSSQRYTVPDGAPLDVLTLKQIVAAQSPPRSRYSLVCWEAEKHVPTLVEPVTMRQDLFRPDKTYWLAGLGGDLGRSLADFMLAHGAANVVISSRTPLVDEKWVAWHEGRGSKIAYHACDLTNFDQAKQVRDDIQKTMPPIAGVANGAMVLRDVVVAQMTFEQLDTVLRSKVQSTLNLNRLFPYNVLDWFVGFSSIVGITGNPGQAAYSAGNAFMKTVIQQRRARGLAGSTIDISRVIGVGYIERESVEGTLTRQQQHRLQTRSGTLPMCETDLHQLLAEAIINGRPGSSVDPEIITGLDYISVEQAKSAFWASNARFGLIVREEGSSLGGQAAGDGRATAVPVRQLLEAAQSMEEVARILLGVLKGKLQALMFQTDADSETQPETTPLVDLGVDSLVGVEMRSWLLKELGVEIPVMTILGGVSALGMVDLIVEKLPPEVKSRFEPHQGDAS